MLKISAISFFIFLYLFIKKFFAVIIYAFRMNKHTLAKQRLYDSTLKNKNQAFFSIKIKKIKLFLGNFEYFLNNSHKNANMQKIIKL